MWPAGLLSDRRTFGETERCGRTSRRVTSSSGGDVIEMVFFPLKQSFVIILLADLVGLSEMKLL